MKASELRIGNTVYTTRDFLGKAWSYTTISHEDIYSIACGNDHQYKPIPLTEEWLLKLGFEYDGVWVDYTKSIGHSRKIGFSLSNIVEISQVINGTFVAVFLKECEFVHQLQNLYFATTGEELTIKF